MTNDVTERLAAALGLDSFYYDFRGHYRDVSADTRLAILAAMGVDTASDAAMDEALRRTCARDDRRMLPPVAVVRASGDRYVTVALPRAAGDVALDWSINADEGRVWSGQVRSSDLTELNNDADRKSDLRHYRAGLPHDLPTGYYRLGIRNSAEISGEAEVMPLIVVPDACFEPDELANGGRLWGLTIQLYTLRSKRNWGIGDFGDLKRLVGLAAGNGVDVVGLNPLHALFPANPGAISPYSPSSRTFLNVFYIDVTAMPGYAQCEALQNLIASEKFRSQLDAARAAQFVDYRTVAALKLAAFRLLYRHFAADADGIDDAMHKNFRDFVKKQGAALELHATFDALHAHFMSLSGTAWGFAQWPDEYRQPDSEAVTEFALAHRDAIDFYLFLQWQADCQLEAAQAAATAAGMRVGLYRDLAVGVDGGGAEAWANQSLYCLDASVGAPPDALAIQGQDWGLPPLDPRRLRDTAYREFSHVIRGNMRHCGALRIDHVMALLRLWWLPRGGSAVDGVYVNYPLDDLLGILALESQRSRCLVIGEDLGTVPDRIRDALPSAGVYSYRVLMFEKNADGSMVAPSAYPARAMATVSTHDLPTLAAFWSGEDLPLRERLGLFPTEDIHAEMVEGRSADRRAILEALGAEELLPDGIEPDHDVTMSEPLCDAIHVYLARSRAGLMVVQLEDLLGERRATNIPGTTDEHPNWQRKLTLDFDSIFAAERIDAICRRLTAERHHRH